MGGKPIVRIERNDTDEKFREKVNSNFASLASVSKPEGDQTTPGSHSAEVFLDSANPDGIPVRCTTGETVRLRYSKSTKKLYVYEGDTLLAEFQGV